MSYEQWFPSIAPPWLQGTVGRALLGAIGAHWDGIAARAKEGVKARFPLDCPEDALASIGEERSIVRGATETADAYRARLADAWTAWTWGGTAYGILKALEAVGFPMGTTGCTVVQQNGRWSQLDANGALVTGDLMNCVNRQDLTGAVNSRPGWTFEHRDNFYSTFGIIIGEDYSTDMNHALLNLLVEQWRPAKAIYCGCWMLMAGNCLGWPTGRTLGDAGEPALGNASIDYFEPPLWNGSTWTVDLDRQITYFLPE
jgi:hypothetical protein